MNQRYWNPTGVLPSGRYTMHQVPEVGQLIGWAGDRKAYRVVAVEDRHQANWHDATTQAWERAGRPAWETWEYRERAVRLRPARDPSARSRGWGLYPWSSEEQWFPLYDPWPECVECGCLWPCPCKDRNDEAAAAMAELERLGGILPGCCWACAKPITARHHSITFEGENLLLPGAGSPAFHISGAHKPDRPGSLLGGSRTCRGAAIHYEKRWVEAAPGRLIRLTCPGTQFRHYESYECDRGETCPGPAADHARAMHCTVGFSVGLPGGGSTPVRPLISCGGKGCRGGAA